MCGIYGEFLFEGNGSLKASINRLDLMKLRGPDGFGFEYGDYKKGARSVLYNCGLDNMPSPETREMNYFFGHRRLSIIDLNDNAFQPMESVNDRFSIIFNGEIYNYIELKEELKKEGCEFKTDHSDTEVLLNSYVIWGPKCIDRFRGMFAFAILDREKREVFIARDRIGQKPLYYELSEERFAFSSDLRPLVEYTSKLRRINSEALSYYVVFGYVPNPISIFEGINKLQPATHAMIDLNNKSIRLTKYWDIDLVDEQNKSTEAFVSETEKQLTNSVSFRLRADVPVGAFISGGTDSTLVVKTITEISSEKFDIYGADFPQPDKSEKKYIKEVARYYSQKLNLSTIDLSHVDSINDVINVFDEPFDGGSSIALFDLFREAAKKYKVILTGDGGDEMFAGYTRYIEFPRRNKIFSVLKKLYFPGKLLSLLPFIGIKNKKLKRISTLINGDFISNFLQLNNDFRLEDLLKKRFRCNVERLSLFKDIKDRIEEKKYSPVKALQYLELNTILPGRMLYKLDRFSMFYSIEARSPFLDHELAQKAFAIPSQFNISKEKTKIIPKKILESDFSMEFVHRKKQGFGNPFSHWFQKSDSDKLYKVLLDRKSEIYNYIDYDSLHDYFPQIKNGYDGEKEKELWRMMVLGQYLENFKGIIET